MDIIIGIGEYGISNNPNDILKTFALAYCVAVTFHSNIKKVAGMIHIALPASFDNNYIDKPSYYAKTGIPLIVNELTKKYGCFKNQLSVQIFGGAKSINNNDFFNIGEKNIETTKNILKELGIAIEKTDTGGFVSRSLEMNVHSGNISISTQPIKI